MVLKIKFGQSVHIALNHVGSERVLLGSLSCVAKLNRFIVVEAAHT